MIQFCNAEIRTNIVDKPNVVAADDPEIFDHPMLHMTGHGNVYFSEDAIENLRTYLLGGGFLHIDDNYGMKNYILPQLKILFPNKELTHITFPKGST